MKTTAFTDLKAQLSEQYDDVPYYVDSGISLDLLRSHVADYLAATPTEAAVIRKATIFASVLSQAQIAINPDDPFVDKLNHGDVVRQAQQEWLQQAEAGRTPLFVAVDALAAFVAFLGFEAQRRDRARFQAGQTDRLAGFLVRQVHSGGDPARDLGKDVISRHDADGSRSQPSLLQDRPGSGGVRGDRLVVRDGARGQNRGRGQRRGSWGKVDDSSSPVRCSENVRVGV